MVEYNIFECLSSFFTFGFHVYILVKHARIIYRAVTKRGAEEEMYIIIEYTSAS